MAKKYVYWHCDNCDFGKNWISIEDASKGTLLKPIGIRCQRCGVGTAPKMPVKVANDRLDCLRLTSVQGRIPLGKPTADGAVAGDGSGPWPLDEYIRRFNVDPRRNWCFRHPDAVGCDDLPSYVPKPDDPGEKPIEEPIEFKALDKLKTDGLISSEVYAAKLIALKKFKIMKDKGLMPDQDEYEKIVMKILGRAPRDILGT